MSSQIQVQFKNVVNSVEDLQSILQASIQPVVNIIPDKISKVKNNESLKTVEDKPALVSLCNSSTNQNQRGENLAKPILFKFPTILVKMDGIGKNHRRLHKDSIHNRDLIQQEPKIGSSKQSLRHKRADSVIELTESTQKVNNMDENII